MIENLLALKKMKTVCKDGKGKDFMKYKISAFYQTIIKYIVSQKHFPAINSSVCNLYSSNVLFFFCKLLGPWSPCYAQ